MELVKKIVKKDNKTYVNLYLDFGDFRIAIKNTYKNDYYVLTKLARNITDTTKTNN